MRAQTLPAAAGWRWITAGFAIYRRNPLTLSMLVVAYWFAIVFLNLFPLIGALAASVAIPGLSVGLMQAACNVERGQSANIRTLLGGFRENTRTLLLLGALYLFATLAALGLSTIVDGGELLRFMLADSREEKAALSSADFTLPALLVALLMTPVLMAWWFAPVLAAWHRLPLGKSLFFSFMACSMNWRPFLVYSLGLLLSAAILPGLVLGLLLIVLPGLQQFAAVIVSVAMALVVAPTVFASFYVGYRDIFGISEIV
ncbi:BPSS1780 family membrane protein [Azonexus sp.]|uniref:BPSS1780 family membrane protein n=1 Tax=Azonexus sp. TaxID=1872668 RepID=UPI0027B9E556|nr:BPSS1780 family membrane protein [Azonexus sp.]